MKLCSLAGLLVLFGTVVHGIPTTSASAPSTADCAAVDAILGVLSEDAAATSYCYSFLGSPTFTYTKTQQTKVATSTSTLYHTAIKVKASPSPITTTVTVSTVTITPSASMFTTTLSLNCSDSHASLLTVSQSPMPYTPEGKPPPPESSEGFDYYKRSLAKTVKPKNAVASTLASYPATDLSTACNCFSVPTPTVTTKVTISVTQTVHTVVSVTGTTTLAPSTTTISITATTTLAQLTRTATQQPSGSCAPAIPSPCGPQGLQVGVYRIQGGFNDKDNDRFDPEWNMGLSRQFAQYLTADTYTGVNVGGETTLWGSSQAYDTTPALLCLVGYIYAPTTGTYTIGSSYANDIFYVWLGDVAYEGWTQYNPNLYIGDYGANQTTYNMKAGHYYPFRTILVNTYAGGGYTLEIQTPDGGGALNTDNIVQYSTCESKAAPAFLTWT